MKNIGYFTGSRCYFTGSRFLIFKPIHNKMWVFQSAEQMIGFLVYVDVLLGANRHIFKHLYGKTEDSYI